MHFFTFATEDTVLYEASESNNFGLDEIIEVRKDVDDAGVSVNVSRILARFDLQAMSQSVVRANAGATAKYYLNMYDAGSDNLTTSQSLYAYPTSGSWNMGRGKTTYSPAETEGCSWAYRTGQNEETYWTKADIKDTGGAWISGSGYEASQSFIHTDTELDMRMDVTDIVNKWFSNNITNNGFMVKRSGSIGNNNVLLDEGSSTQLGNFKFFSRDTHTIYSPRLEAVWNSHVWNTGSLQKLDASDLEDLQIYSTNLKSRYSNEFDGKIRIVGRTNNPTLSNSPTASAYSVVKYLPTGSQYSVLDNYSDDVVIPYGTGSYISCDSRGNFIDLNTSGLQVQREYKLLIKVISGSFAGSNGTDTEVIDNKFTFFIK
jgi:hypothetical protein